MTATNRLGLDCFEENEGNAEIRLNENQDKLDVLINLSVVTQATSAEPGSPTDGDAYLLPGSGVTGTDWAGHDGEVAMFHTGTGWRFVTPYKGLLVWVIDEKTKFMYDGTDWLGTGITTPELGITASSTQTQGQRPLTRDLNVVDTVGTLNDVVTLPPCRPNRTVTVFNFGANQLQVFPASGDQIDANGVNNSVDISLAMRAVRFHGVTSALCYSEVLGAEA